MGSAAWVNLESKRNGDECPTAECVAGPEEKCGLFTVLAADWEAAISGTPLKRLASFLVRSLSTEALHDVKRVESRQDNLNELICELRCALESKYFRIFSSSPACY